MKRKAMSLDQLQSKIYRAFRDATDNGNPNEPSPGYVEETYADHLIVNVAGTFMKVPFSMTAEGEVEISDRSEWREVERAWLVKMLERRAKAGKSSMLIHKQADGDYRWFGWVSNHFRDRDNPPEILSGKAHKRFVKWADKTGNYPELWFWHVPGTKVGKADWLEFADGFLMASGLFDKDKADVAERLAESKESFTMSHGFERLVYDAEKVVTDGYLMHEVSILPPGPEANPWTSFRTIGKEASMISEKKRAFLLQYIPAETLKAIEENTEALKTAAESAGVDWKEVEAIDEATETETKEAPEAQTFDVKSLAVALVKELQLESLSDMVAELKTKTDTITVLTEKIEGLEAVVKELKKSDDEKLAQAMIPKAAKALSWFKEGFVASESEKTMLKEGDEDDEKLKQAGPSALARFISNIGQ